MLNKLEQLSAHIEVVGLTSVVIGWQVEVEPVSKHVADSDRGSKHERRSRLVCREEDGLHLQG